MNPNKVESKPASKTPIRVQSFVLCDDIRQENTGKLILIGVYTGGIVISPNRRVPLVMRLAAYIHFNRGVDSGKGCKLAFYPPEQKSPMFEGEFEDIDSKQPFIIFQIPNFVFPVLGRYRIKITIQGRSIYDGGIDVARALVDVPSAPHSTGD